MTGYSPPTNLQTVAASTAPQLPLSPLLNKPANDTKPDTVFIHDTVSCNHKLQSATKTVIKRTVIKKTDTSYVPLLWIAEPGDKTDSINHDYTIRKGELRDYKQIISKVCE